MKLLPLLLFLFSLVPIHQTIIVSAVSPVSSPISSPLSASMTAFSPGIELGGEEHKKMLIALILACSSLGAIISSLCCLWIYYRKNSCKSTKNEAKSSDAERRVSLAPFFGKFKSMRTVSREGSASFIDYKILEKASNKFHPSNNLGVGGFGCVYKAQFDDGSYAVVNKLDCANQDAEKEFENEVDLLCRFRHSNIISLLGYSSENDSRFIVYELMQNGSLETQLHGPCHGSSLTWQRRMKIALDSARGLEYLHEHCNPPVILLDSDFNAKLSDFGLAVTDSAQNKNNLKLSGTLGYVAPEYLLDGPSRGVSLTWSIRLRIAFDIVCHVIHRDLKSANILLDSNFNAKIGDFAVAKPVVERQEIDITDLSGTVGYAAPEYLVDSIVSDKGDMYAFGIILLELLFGPRPIETLGTKNESLRNGTKNLLTDMEVMRNVVDPVIRSQIGESHLRQITSLARSCVKADPRRRSAKTDIVAPTATPSLD